MPADSRATGTALCLAFSWLLVAQLFAAPLATRFGLVSYKLGLPITALAFLGGVLMLLVAAVLGFRRDFRPYRRRLALVAALAAVPALAGVTLILSSRGLPLIHDVSTNVADPPRFESAPSLRGEDANPLDRGQEVDEAQQQAYPDIGSIQSQLSPAEAFERCTDTAKQLGWEVFASDEQTGRIEASDTTFWFGFTDDVVIRIRGANGGSVIDLRSVSRVGRGDLGANAKRIRAFAAAFRGEGV